jgi:hypothetical protein
MPYITVRFEDKYHNPYDLVGEIISPEDLCGLVDKYPRRQDMPFYKIDLYAGDNKTYRVLLRDRDVNPIDVTGGIGVLTVKKYKTDTSAVIQKRTDTAGEGELGSADIGEMFFYLVPADTESLETRQYVFDVQFKAASGNVYTTMEGTLNLGRPVNEATI